MANFRPSNVRIASALGDEPSLHFWRDQGEGYKLLCHLSDAGDWTAILETIAAEIAARVPGGRGSIRILDVGSGTGTTAASISKLLLTRYGITTRWTLVEPSDEARLASGLLFAAEAVGTGSANAYAELSQVPVDDSHDVALMVHSTYYLGDLSETIRSIREEFGCEIVVALSLPNSSPFFLPGSSLPGCAHEVVAALERSGFDVFERALVSRVKLPSKLLENDAALHALKALVGKTGTSDSEFRRMLVAHWTTEVNFGDHLIVGVRDKSEGETTWLGSDMLRR